MNKTLEAFKEWMRFNPPSSLSPDGWHSFREEFLEKAPIRYWCTYTYKRKLAAVRAWYHRCLSWVVVRTIKKDHIVNTGLGYGHHDLETRFLHSAFQVFVEYVETEFPTRYYYGKPERKLHWPRSITAQFNRRQPTEAMNYLAWLYTLDDPLKPHHENDAISADVARELTELYKWWTIVRPARKKVDIGTYDRQGVLGPLATMSTKFDKDAPDYVAFRNRIAESQDQYIKWADEDDAMLTRLINIRRNIHMV